MNEIIFELKDEFIELIRLLKATRIAQSGAEAKIFVEEGLVQLNGQPESRKRAKIRPGDKVTVDGNIISVK
ncbi:RNA-binding S4 domain-containing protein [Williamwhitmania taraxaci]|uniref:Ribosome-associated protein n=1 Tax=Williamwhitmania taraxaci TaxID=1640674 RepID=A0A1G6TDQ7_9BACT|nr:RNA-binding S4 domain-containing protein [Williamwhitmania taraxaci]SDD27201.1 ribosome-associated protein [Williamwhitmania taraxaci]